MTTTYVVRTEFPSGSFARYFENKRDAAQSVLDLLMATRLGPASIMTIRQESSEEYFVFIVTIGSWEDTETRNFFNEWWTTFDKTQAS